MIGVSLLSPTISVAAYLVPWIVYAAACFVSSQVLRARVGAHKRKVTRSSSFAVLAVVVIVGLFVGKVVVLGTANVVNGLAAAPKGLVLLGLGSLMALLLGTLTAVNFYKNLLVRRFGIDLAPLYQED
jgi:hypothetical protein